MSWIFPPAAQPALPIVESDAKFPVRRIYNVGQNYAAHAREMGQDPDPEPPFFFSKPADSLVMDGAEIPFPPETDNLHFEAELVVAIGTGGAGILAEDALDHVFGYAVGNDLTRRDLQADAKGKGRPWDMAKGFDLSAPCGPVYPAAAFGHPQSGRISLSVNGVTKQNSNLSDMIWSVPDIISYLSRFVTLAPGDLIFSGTPEGVGRLVQGDVCVVEIADFAPLTTRIAP